jgi:hypothetical protein
MTETMDSTAADAGPGRERRRNQLVITGNTEYHVRDGAIVAVRPRGEPGFLHAHTAIGLRLDPSYGPPREGARLWLVNQTGRVLLTTPIVTVEQPPLEAVQAYPADCEPAEWPAW